mgnify:CR=1 FL=1
MRARDDTTGARATAIGLLVFPKVYRRSMANLDGDNRNKGRSLLAGNGRNYHFTKDLQGFCITVSS